MTEGELRLLRHLVQRDARERMTRCTGKQRFGSRGDALVAVSRNLAAAGAHPYRCSFCAGWHVGAVLGLRRSRPSDSDRKSAGHRGHRGRYLLSTQARMSRVGVGILRGNRWRRLWCRI